MKNASRITVSTFGVIMGVAGIEHGIGEILQGNRPPSGMVIQSWPDSEVYEILAGEPAFTVIPNLLITGILALIISLLLIIWAVAFIHKQHGGIVLIGLTLVLFLFGGGFAPPIIGLIIGLAGTRINSQFTWLKAHFSANTRQFFAKIWPFSYAVSIISYFSLWPGLIILGYFTRVTNPAIVFSLVLISYVTLLLTIFSGFASDSINNTTNFANDN